MIGKSLEDYWRTIGGLLENLARNPSPTSRPLYLLFLAGQPPTPRFPQRTLPSHLCKC